MLQIAVEVAAYDLTGTVYFTPQGTHEPRGCCEVTLPAVWYSCCIRMSAVPAAQDSVGVEACWMPLLRLLLLFVLWRLLSASKTQKGLQYKAAAAAAFLPARSERGLRAPALGSWRDEGGPPCGICALVGRNPNLSEELPANSTDRASSWTCKKTRKRLSAADFLQQGAPIVRGRLNSHPPAAARGLLGFEGAPAMIPHGGIIAGSSDNGAATQQVNKEPKEHLSQ